MRCYNRSQGQSLIPKCGRMVCLHCQLHDYQAEYEPAPRFSLKPERSFVRVMESRSFDGVDGRQLF